VDGELFLGQESPLTVTVENEQSLPLGGVTVITTHAKAPIVALFLPEALLARIGRRAYTPHLPIA